LRKFSDNLRRLVDGHSAVREERNAALGRLQLIPRRTVPHEVGERERRGISGSKRVEVYHQRRIPTDGETDRGEHTQQMIGLGPQSDDGHGNLHFGGK
jgi:hypothetical protein